MMIILIHKTHLYGVMKEKILFVEDFVLLNKALKKKYL